MLRWTRDRLTGGKGFKFWFILSLVITLSAPLVLFEPYDWLQRGLTDEINQKPYNGDATIIAIDRDTVETLPGKVWTRVALADVIETLDKAGAERIFIDRQRFSTENQKGGEKLAAVLAQLERKAVWHIDLPSSRMTDLAQDASLSHKNGQSENPGNFPPEEIDQLVEQSTLDYGQSPFGTPIYIPLTTTWQGKIFPSISQVMADSDAPIKQVSRWFDEKKVIDTSYDIDSIPLVSARQVLTGKFSAGKIIGKKVVITDLGDPAFTLQKTFTPRAAIGILGAQTILDGPQYQLYVWPSLIIALFVSLAWTILPHPLGRFLAFGGFLFILISPFILERFLVYQNTSQSVFFLVVFAIGRLVIRSREALKAYRGIAESKSRFLAQASHDLRQPIHAIGLLAERLQQTSLSEAQKDIVSKISWSTDNASRMFKSLLDLAILESGTLEPKLSAVPINDLLVEIDNQNALIAEQAGITLRFVPSETTIYTDRALTNTMLQNLVSNAIKYGANGDILIGCRRLKNTIALCVYDQGPGISKKEVQLVSQEFYRGKKLEIAGADGVGLGLAIVRGLADLLKLEFVLRSNRGNGTVAKIGGFSIVQNSQPPFLLNTNEDSDILSGKQVLAIDDDRDTLQSTASVLEMWGCNVTTAASVPSNELTAFDIILSDFDFGNGNTLAAYREDISKLRKSGVCVIIVSGHHPGHIEKEMDRSGITILAKPVHPADLKSALTAELLKKYIEDN